MYPKKKVKKITSVVKKKCYTCQQVTVKKVHLDKFNNSTKRGEQTQILTILPQSWSVRKIEKEFGASNYMARKARKLVKAKGLLSTANPKPGKIMKDDTVKLVCEFYDFGEISRCMSGTKILHL
jgi:hypothetical protein